MSIDKSTDIRERRLLRGFRYAHALFGGISTIFILVIVANAYLVTFFRVDGHSMDPTLSNGQLLPVILVGYLLEDPRFNDIVIVQSEGELETRFVKRVLGTPGRIVSYKGQDYRLGDDEYFVVGDNRNHSTDSRTYGPIKGKQIIGRVVGTYAEAPAGDIIGGSIRN